jgi:sarcosine/dimethylglycine N-methyltransferase
MNDVLATNDVLDMNNVVDDVREHYNATGLTKRLKAALAILGPDEQPLQPHQLAPLDQFHTRGMAATAELATLAEINEEMSVLDVGSGLGGPARFLAATYGCQVIGIDLSERFVEAARYLTQRTGQQEQVAFEEASALELPFEDARFDVLLLQHVAMNIADRPSLYAEIRRVLRVGGRLAIYDIVLRGGEPLYPVPWAKTPATSFLLSSAETLEAIEQAGFHPMVVRDDTEAAKAWAIELRAGSPPSPLNLGLVMGPSFAEVAGNLGRNLLEGRLGVLTAVFQVAPERHEEGQAA